MLPLNTAANLSIHGSSFTEIHDNTYTYNYHTNGSLSGHESGQSGIYIVL